MFQPITTATVDQAGYQQALHDFAVNQLLHRLNTYSDASFDASRAALKTQESEALAALLIQTLSATLKGNLLAAYLETMRSKTLATVPLLSNLPMPPPATALPLAFPAVERSRFLYGDRLRWLTNSQTTDWGVVIGSFYSFAPHRCNWHWCHLIWLDPDSPSAMWVTADMAWEDDLEPMVTEETR